MKFMNYFFNAELKLHSYLEFLVISATFRTYNKSEVRLSCLELINTMIQLSSSSESVS